MLRMLYALADRCMTESPEYKEKILKSFPVDMRTVRKLFDIGAETTTYASCPSCACLYKVEDEFGRPTNLKRCTNKRFSKLCDAKLMKLGAQNGKTIKIPRKPYVVQSFNAFVGRLLCRPGMEKLLERSTGRNVNEQLWDVMEGLAVGQLKTHDGQPFLDNGSNELRLVWSLSVDWFNPFMNKAAGQSASSGMIAMTCLNLPPNLRYKIDNMYLAAVIPGRKEPSNDEINHYMAPIVDQLLASYLRGTHYMVTSSSPTGRSCKSAVVAGIFDLPAARKVGGFAHYSSNANFCKDCKLNRQEINRLDWWAWEKRELATHIKHAVEWRDASSPGEREMLYKQHGVRWSELLRLPYWNPLKFVIIDGMHNLFLGLTRYHVLSIVGFDPEFKDNDATTRKDKTPTQKALKYAREVVDASSDIPSICKKRPHVSALKALCAERSIDLPEDDSRLSCRDLVKLLKVSQKSNIHPKSEKSNRVYRWNKRTPKSPAQLVNMTSWKRKHG